MAHVADPTLRNDRLVDHDSAEWERLYSVFQHLTLLVHVPVILVPAIVMWLIKKDASPFVDDHGRESINFQISLIIYYLISLVLVPVCYIGVPIMFAVWALGIVGMIMGAMAAGRGEYYRYPMCIRFLK
jgi:uncharacterized protein